MDDVVVVGSGLAGLRVVEALRREGYDRRVTLVGDEPEPPYDRPPLSKDILVGTREPDTIILRTSEKLAELDAQVQLGTAASELDLADHTIRVGDSKLGFDKLVIATGATPRALPDLAGIPGVFTLRTLGDALAIRDAFERAEQIAVVGAGFIGSEVAASARARGLDVTVIEMEPRPLSRVLGPEIADALTRLHQENGTSLRLGASIDRAERDGDGRLCLQLTDGSTVAADAVVVGIGVVPNTAWLGGSGLELENGVVCDAGLATAHPDVLAVGDVASWPNELFGRRMRVEHWTNATDQAKHVARRLVHGTSTPFVGSNYVWSDQYGVRIQFVGAATGEFLVVSGGLDELKFLAWYRDGDRLSGAVAIGEPSLVMKSRALIEQRAGWAEALAELEH